MLPRISDMFRSSRDKSPIIRYLYDQFQPFAVVNISLLNANKEKQITLTGCSINKFKE